MVSTTKQHFTNSLKIKSNHKQCLILKANSFNGDFSSESSSPKGNKGRKFPNPFALLRRLILSINNSRVQFVKRFQLLSRAGKVIVSMQLLAITLLAGSIGRKAYTLQSSRSTATEGATSVLKRSRTAVPVEIPYSTFLDLAEKNGKGSVPGKHPAIQLENVIIGRERISFRVKPDQQKQEEAAKQKKYEDLMDAGDVSTREVIPRNVFTMKPMANQDLLDLLRDNDISFRAASTKANRAISQSLRGAIVCVYLLFLVRLYRSMSGAGPGGGGNTPGKLASKNSNSDRPLITFDDIEGIDKAKYEVMELVDTLRNPQKYAILGARAPKGLLLEGPPGTGKTMLARATAATAGVPLLYCSGSDFVEMFVGRGAARVRKTFARAAKMSPCIIFVDELDALGKSRDTTGLKIQSNDEAEQTLNQLLACMDGLDSTTGICVLAATNRREVLDSALLRPGRFDRIVKVTLPDAKGREKILRVHAKKLPGFEEGTGIDDKRLGR